MPVADPVVDPIAVAPLAAGPPSRRGVLSFTAPLATLGVLAALVGVVLLALPVHSPLQDCGSSFGFLIDGRSDLFGDPAAPPKGASRADVEATNARPCRPRVATRAKPAAFLIPGGVVAGVGAATTEVAVRWRRSRRRGRGPPSSALPR